MIQIFEMYKKACKVPLGRYFFNKSIGIVAPFFGKIRPNVVELGPTRCVVRMKDRWGIRNHIGTVNAGAMCTLAELTGGMAVDATIPSHLRWIPKKMTVSYLKKGKGPLEAVCEFDSDLLKEGDVTVPVDIDNDSEEKVFTAEITFHISKKKV